MIRAMLATAILMLMASPASALCQPFEVWDVPSTSQAHFTYISLVNDLNISTSSAANEGLYDHFHAPVALNVSNLRAEVLIAPGGAANDDVWTIILRKNTSTDTSLTCQITGTELTCSDLVNTAAIDAGDTLHLKVVSSDGNSAPSSSGFMMISLCMAPQ